MGTASDARSGQQRWPETRLARGLLFLGIVWSIAGGFLLLLNGLPMLTDLVLKRGWLSPEIAIDNRLREEAARRCAQLDTARIALDGAALQRARYAAYQMGKHFGTAAVARSSGAVQPELLDPLLQEVKRQAMALGVPSPDLLPIRHMATELGEFMDDLEADRQCTATRLAGRYTPAHGEIYRFGSVVGYALPACARDRCAAFGVHIRRYGEAAGLPEHLWLSMTQRSLADVPGPTVREKAFRIVLALDEHIRTGR